MKLILIGCIASSAAFCALPDDEAIARRVYAHLLIHDPSSAVIEARHGLSKYPDSKDLQRSLLRALCENGEEMRALQEWEKGFAALKADTNQRSALETLAWGVLLKSENSPQLFIRITALLGAAFTQDAKAVSLLVNHMRDSNSLLRIISIRLAASFGDAPLQDELARLLKEEKIWYVRLEIIKAIGQLRMTTLKNALKEIVGNPKTIVEEKVVAIFALVGMYDTIDVSELNALLSSPRAGLRQLGCDLVTNLELKDRIGDVLVLLRDSSPDVRMAALNAVGLLGVDRHDGKPMMDFVAPKLEDRSPEVSITASYVAMLLKDKRGEETLKTWLRCPNAEWRRLASAALAVTGKQGIALAWGEMVHATDPYVKVNLALGLIGQRQYIREACESIDAVLLSEKDKLWMWDAHVNPLFRCLAPSRMKHNEQIPHYPMVADRLVRLELLSVLSVMRYAQAQVAVKEFLQHPFWGIAGAAAANLLEEGDEEAMQCVRNLLSDPEEKIRVQAALILAMLGGDPAAIKVLQEAYPQVDRETKIYILEALARVGDPSSVPFLMEILKEPFQILRVVAASALIQCLHH
jgi:HEAT repeat protein